MPRHPNAVPWLLIGGPADNTVVWTEKHLIEVTECQGLNAVAWQPGVALGARDFRVHRYVPHDFVVGVYLYRIGVCQSDEMPSVSEVIQRLAAKSVPPIGRAS